MVDLHTLPSANNSVRASIIAGGLLRLVGTTDRSPTVPQASVRERERHHRLRLRPRVHLHVQRPRLHPAHVPRGPQDPEVSARVMLRLEVLLLSLCDTRRLWVLWICVYVLAV